MTIKNFPLFIMAVALHTATLAAGDKPDELQPCDGLYSGFGPEPYYLALRDSLLGEHNYRLCQILAIPSFEPEWTVYLIQDGSGHAQIIYKAMKVNLWSEMCDKIKKNTNSTSFRTNGHDAIEALSQLKKEVVRALAPISGPTTVLLQQVWGGMLARVRYPQPDGSIGLDGITYHVSHWERGSGFRSGTTWSPEEGSRTSAFVQLAEDLRNYVLAQNNEQPTLELAMTNKAKALLVRLR
jgi:hypothetical protein